LEQAPPVLGGEARLEIADIARDRRHRRNRKTTQTNAIAKIASTAKIVNLKKTGFWLLAIGQKKQLLASSH
jgi:hypothetical protein